MRPRSSAASPLHSPAAPPRRNSIARSASIRPRRKNSSPCAPRCPISRPKRRSDAKHHPHPNPPPSRGREWEGACRRRLLLVGLLRHGDRRRRFARRGHAVGLLLEPHPAQLGDQGGPFVLERDPLIARFALRRIRHHGASPSTWAAYRFVRYSAAAACVPPVPGCGTRLA